MRSLKGVLLCLVSTAILLGPVVQRTYAQATFSDVTETAGVGDVLFGTGLAWGDYDNDGDLDLYVGNWGGGAPSNPLYRNEGNGRFTEVGEEAGVESKSSHNSSAVWGDYDNDGDLDLYVTDYNNQDLLYQNNGDGTFQYATGKAGVNLARQGNEMAAVWGDYNNDGYLDLYICKYYFANELYFNNGDGTFTEIAGDVGADDERDSDGAVWTDYDDDGDLDLYVINREQENGLYRNEDGTFVAVGAELGLDDIDLGRNGSWGDYDNDGDLDLSLANIGANALYQNNGGIFQNVARAAGVRSTGIGWISWDTAWGDYDNDEDLDLYVANGADSKNGEGNVLFSNNGDGTFSDVTESARLGNVQTSSTAAGWGDYDNDGDLDLYVVNYGRNTLYQNDANSGNFIKVRVQGAGTFNKSNTSGIGAKVRLFESGTGVLRGFQEIRSGANALEAVFGVASGKQYEVEVTFPNQGRTVQRQTEVAPGQTVVVVEEP